MAPRPHRSHPIHDGFRCMVCPRPRKRVLMGAFSADQTLRRGPMAANGRRGYLLPPIASWCGPPLVTRTWPLRAFKTKRRPGADPSRLRDRLLSADGPTTRRDCGWKRLTFGAAHTPSAMWIPSATPRTGCCWTATWLDLGAGRISGRTPRGCGRLSCDGSRRRDRGSGRAGPGDAGATPC